MTIFLIDSEEFHQWMTLQGITELPTWYKNYIEYDLNKPCFNIAFPLCQLY
jgi:hypothetical protein